MHLATHSFAPQTHRLKVLKLFRGWTIYFVFRTSVIQITRTIVPGIRKFIEWKFNTFKIGTEWGVKMCFVPIGEESSTWCFGCPK
jgi:hypothetical protein